MQIHMMFWEYMFWELILYLYGVISVIKISARSFHFWKCWEYYLIMGVLPVLSLKNKNWLSWYWYAWVCLHNFYPDVGSAYELPVNKRFICTLHCMVMNQECWPLSLRISIVPGVGLGCRSFLLLQMTWRHELIVSIFILVIQRQIVHVGRLPMA